MKKKVSKIIRYVVAGLICLYFAPHVFAIENVLNQLYTGTRNNMEGRVGYTLTAKKSFQIDALGRPINPNYNNGTLVSSHCIQIFDVNTGTLVTSAIIDGNSVKDSLGYAFTLLPSPVTLSANKEYMLLSSESLNGLDRWMDGSYITNYRTDYVQINGAEYGGTGTTMPPVRHGWGANAAYCAPTFSIILLSVPNISILNIFNQNLYGTRNDFTGRVGYSFYVKKNMIINGLGRGVNLNYNSGILQDSHIIELFDILNSKCIGSAVVKSTSQMSNGYAFAPLDTPVFLAAGREYMVLSQERSADGDPFLTLGYVPGSYSNSLMLIEGAEWSGYGPGSSMPTVSKLGGIDAAYVGPALSVDYVQGDLSGDFNTNFADLGLFARQWLRNDCNASNIFCNHADIFPVLASDGKVDFHDFVVFAQNWFISSLPEYVEEDFTFSSSFDGKSPLYARVAFKTSSKKAPLMVVQHGYNGSRLDVMCSARRMEQNGFFCLAIDTRGWGGSTGAHDDGGIEIRDIYDGIQAALTKYPEYIDANKISMIGYSNGGGNTFFSTVRFPFMFRASMALFGIPNYGEWITLSSGFRDAVIAAVGGTPETVPDKYLVRNSDLAAKNLSGTRFHIAYDAAETLCPPIMDQEFVAAVDPSQNANVFVHISQVTDQNRWTHGYNSDGHLNGIEDLFMADIIDHDPCTPLMPSSGNLTVLGFIITPRFTCSLGSGEDTASTLSYSFGTNGAVFEFSPLTSIIQTVGTLTIMPNQFACTNAQLIINGQNSRMIDTSIKQVINISANSKVEIQCLN